MVKRTPAESPSRDVIDLYRRRGAAWARARGDRLVEQAWLDRFLALLPARPRVLDLGCGSGRPIGRYLIERGCEITGIDASEEMIATCRRDFPGHTWLVGDMRRLDLAARFDGVLAWDSFFHLNHEDQRLMFPLFGRHSGTAAALMFTSGPAHGEAIGSLEGEPLYHASLAPEEYRALLAAQGFEVAAHVAEDPDHGGHTVWLARRSPEAH